MIKLFNKNVKSFIITMAMGHLCFAQVINVTDIPISTVVGNNQAENAVFISPLSKYVIINSNNSSPIPNTPVALGDVSYFISTNGGLSWTGNIYGIDTDGYGDPSVVINRDGRIIVSYLSYLPSPRHLTISYTDDNGSNWTTIQVPGTFVSADKEHLWVDNNLNSPYEGRIYMAFNDPGTYLSWLDIVFTYSDDGGATWLTPLKNISSTVYPLPLLENLGVNLQTGPQGQIYACWSGIDYYNASTANNMRLFFNKSTDGGDNWLSGGAVPIRTVTGAVLSLGGGKNPVPKAYPFMAVNQQTGMIYLVWANNNGTPGNSSMTDSDIYMIKSEDEGDTWSTTPIRVNKDPVGNFIDQWSPWIACDEISNAIVVMYYDSRNFPANPATNRAETFVSISYDDGNTWEDHRISDPGEDWSGSFYWIPGMDYNQVDVYHGFCVPVWSDNRSSAGTDFRAYTNPFQVPCPSNLDLIYGNYDIYDQGDYTDYANQLYDGLYRTTGTINVAGSGSAYKVHAGAEVLMEAGEEIVLNDGFESEGEFLALPNPSCTSFSEKWSGNEDENQIGNSDSYAENNSENLIKRKDEAVKKKIVPSYRIYPNPSNGKFIIILNNHPDLEISVNNPLGEAVYRSKIFHHKTEIDLSSNPPGLYFVKVITGEAVFIEKIVLK